MPRPPRGREKLTIHLPPDLIRRARIAAAAEGVPLGDLIEEALESYLAKKKGDPK